jgi:hypothetical protein
VVVELQVVALLAPQQAVMVGLVVVVFMVPQAEQAAQDKEIQAEVVAKRLPVMVQGVEVGQVL